MADLILVIEDEPGIVDFLRRGLTAEGFAVIDAADGVSGTELGLAEPVDLVVLDLMLPERSGLQVLARLREAKPTLPVIALTARGEIADRVAGLDAGATDYITKPFSLSELSARIRAQLRTAAQAAPQLRAGDIELDLIERSVRRGGNDIRMSNTEFDLLAHMVRHRGEVLSREQLLRAVWGVEHDPGTNLVDVYVGYVRRKLRDADGSSPIVTVRSVGYRLDAGR